MEPLLDRIARNSTTVVCPVIDVIDDTTMEYHWRDSGGVNVGGFDWSLQFNWHAVPERERKRHKVGGNIYFKYMQYNAIMLYTISIINYIHYTIFIPIMPITLYIDS